MTMIDGAGIEFDPDQPSSRYFNRELSWMQFNSRVLAQAEDRRLPLLERLKFCAIYGSNLDEFYICLLYTSPSPRDRTRSRMPSSA